MMPNITLNVELLIKLMKLTTSSTDGEALAAIRAANRALNAGGADWENLLRGKLAPIDPFATLPEPKAQPSAPPPPQSKPYYARPQPFTSRPTPPPPPPPSANRGIDKKEAALITQWLLKCEFGSLDSTTLAQVQVIETKWKRRKGLTDLDFNYLKAAAASA